ncbi:DUF4252 domain-containing protein [Lacinutrix undariae]
MKKTTLILALALMPILSFGQSIFDKFEDEQAVTSIVLNQKMFSMLSKINIDLDDPEAQQYLETVKKITGLKVFTTGDDKISEEMNSAVNSYLKTSTLEELMRIKDGGQTVKFYVKEGSDENHVKELLMFINGLKELTADQDITINGKKREVETVLLSLTGDIDLRQISKITNSMNIPGGEHLEKASKKN